MKSFRLLVLFFTLLLLPASIFAHIGSSEVLMQGNAGPYKVLVSIQPPDVIPGVARVTVYLQEAGISSVSARAVYFRSGNEGAPPADEMKTTNLQPGRYLSDVWLMNGGSSSVQINIRGSKGQGEVTVPVVAIATAKKDLPVSTGFVLIALGIFLLLLLLTIIGASVGDGVTTAGEEISSTRKKTKLKAIAVAGVLIALTIGGGWMWWQSLSDEYEQYLYQPTPSMCAVSKRNGVSELNIALDTTENAQRKTLYSFVVPDHGKMMHLFVVRVPAMDAFAHLHPVRIDEANYRTILPQLPEGRYMMFADIVYVSGFTETISNTFDIGTSDTSITSGLLDRDDSYVLALPADLKSEPEGADAINTIICGKPGRGVKMKDGSIMSFEDYRPEPFEAGKLYQLKFSVTTADQRPVTLDPYMGMAGHAAIIRSDGSVYIHLHPMGTMSTAAETNFEKRLSDPQREYTYPEPTTFRDSVDTYMEHLSGLSDSARENLLMKQMNMPQAEDTSASGMKHSNIVEFPYSFPSPGRYRIWVQVKRNGEVLSAAFDKTVE